MVLDTDDDGLANFEEEQFGTNPTSRDSDMDMIDDIVEVSNTSVSLFVGTGEDCNVPLLESISRAAPFMAMERAWFLQDMDNDGINNGPSDWDTDGDGMPMDSNIAILIKENTLKTMILRHSTLLMPLMDMVTGTKME